MQISWRLRKWKFRDYSENMTKMLYVFHSRLHWHSSHQMPVPGHTALPNWTMMILSWPLYPRHPWKMIFTVTLADGELSCLHFLKALLHFFAIFKVLSVSSWFLLLPYIYYTSVYGKLVLVTFYKSQHMWQSFYSCWNK